MCYEVIKLLQYPVLIRLLRLHDLVHALLMVQQRHHLQSMVSLIDRRKCHNRARLQLNLVQHLQDDELGNPS